MTLNCWVRDHDIRHIFTVQISSTKTVAALQRAIKNKKPVVFRDIDTSALNLYKVSLRYGEDNSLEGVLGARTISSLGQPLWISRKLSSIFTPLPADDQLHLIIGMWHLGFEE